MNSDTFEVITRNNNGAEVATSVFMESERDKLRKMLEKETTSTSTDFSYIDILMPLPELKV